jgi:hypothetical protein
MFREAGLDKVSDDPAVLSVRGRLLKDQAREAKGQRQRRLFLDAADAYARASEIGGATYPLINAATLSLLAGRGARARTLAQRVLEKSERDPEEAETPYYREATRAEALLLLGNIARAKQAFAAAMALAPQAYEDHASTLRQFELILDELGEDHSWLDALRPPRTLHFAGHMALAGKNGALAQEVRAAIAEQHIGSGYGALAAGADILIAEALLQAGAELHLILPAPKDEFRKVSVARSGGDWPARFDRVIAATPSVRAIESPADPASPLAIRLAAEVAMGLAVMQAQVLATEAVQLLILDGRTGDSGWIAGLWKRSGRRQQVLAAPRVRSRGKTRTRSAGEHGCLAAMLRIDGTTTLSTELLRKLARALSAAAKPLVPPRWTGEAVLAAFDSAAAAARAALAVRRALGERTELRIAGHYGIAERAKDPFGRGGMLIGPATDLPRVIAMSTPAGAIHVSEDFAAALHAGSAAGRPHCELVGELPGDEPDNPVRLFSLRR